MKALLLIMRLIIEVIKFFKKEKYKFSRFKITKLNIQIQMKIQLEKNQLAKPNFFIYERILKILSLNPGWGGIEWG